MSSNDSAAQTMIGTSGSSAAIAGSRSRNAASLTSTDSHAIPAILDDAPDDMPSFGDEQAARSQQIAVAHRAKGGDARVATQPRSRCAMPVSLPFFAAAPPSGDRAAAPPVRARPRWRARWRRRSPRRPQIARVDPVERVGRLVVNVLVSGVVRIQIERRNPRQDERRAVRLKGITEAVVERRGAELPQEISASAAGRRGSGRPGPARSSR